MTARLRALASRVIRNDMSFGWIHDEDVMLHVPRDASCDSFPSLLQKVAEGDPINAAPAMLGIGTASDANRVCIVCEFLENAGALL